MRVFITGATGFAGSHLVEQLLAAGDEVCSFVHPATSRQALPTDGRIWHVEGDLLDVEGLTTAVAEVQPDVIYHLAGQAYPARSWQIPGATLAVNTVGTANVLQAAVAYGRPRVVVVTSADVYGPIQPHELPLTEQTVAAPRHPYGVSKYAAGLLVPLFWQRFGLPVVEARPFNHIGPRQALGFVVPDFASQVAGIKLGQQDKRILVGNLDAQRDFTDVRDVARAYRLLAERGQPGEAYLICSGQPISIHYLLTTLVELARVDVHMEYDPARMRPSDTPTLYGSFAKIKRDTGWLPEIHVRQSLAESLAEWLAQLGGG
jgi:GDP-4-dehydro-6-deoxy-D-mannose reductase